MHIWIICESACDITSGNVLWNVVLCQQEGRERGKWVGFGVRWLAGCFWA